MTEQDMLNNDTMFWREINYYLPSDNAEIELYQSIVINGAETNVIQCSLLPFESDMVIHELENGGAMKRNEVIRWPFILSENRSFFTDLAKLDEGDQSKIDAVRHQAVKVITLRNRKGDVVFSKGKV